MIYRVTSETGQKMKLKIAVNTRAHFTVFGHQCIPFELNSSRHKESCLITTFSLEELLSTKLRALYQRKNGKDLFDLWYALKQYSCNPEQIIEGWRIYMKEEGNSVSRREFEMNLDDKMGSAQFTGDMGFLLVFELNRLRHTVPNLNPVDPPPPSCAW